MKEKNWSILGHDAGGDSVGDKMSQRKEIADLWRPLLYESPNVGRNARDEHINGAYAELGALPKEE